MTLVRFAFVCDQCQERGPEYGAIGKCAICGDDVCDKCAPAADGETRHVICKSCDDRRFHDPDYKREDAENAERAYPDKEWERK